MEATGYPDNQTYWSNTSSRLEVSTIPAIGTSEILIRTGLPPHEPWIGTLRYVCEVGLTLPIAILGILGNLLAFVVLCNHKQKSTTRVLLQALAVSDFLILLCGIVIRSFRYVITGYVGGYSYMYMYRWLYPSVYVLRLGGTWLTVLLTVDRFIAVCHPLHAQRLCTLRRTYFLMALLMFTTLLFSVPRFLEYEIYHRNGSKGIRPSAFLMNRHYTISYRIIIFFIIMYLTPMVLLVTLNSWLLRALRQASAYRSELQAKPIFTRSFNSKATKKTSFDDGHRNSEGNPIAPPPAILGGGRSGSSSGMSPTRSNNRSVTVIVITVVLVSIICNVTAMLAHVLWSLTTSFEYLIHLDTTRRVISNISNVLVTFNSAVNFVIYCLCSRNFRNVCMRTFRIDRLMMRMKRSRLQEASNRKLNASSTSYISLLRLTNNIHKNNNDCTCHGGKDDKLRKKNST